MRPARMHPVADLSQRKPLKQACALALIETAGLSVLFVVYWLLHVSGSVLDAFIAPTVVSFLLVLVTSDLAISRPLRVITAYAVAGSVGFALAALPGPTFVIAVLAGGITMFLMHMLGIFHAPAITIPMLVVLTSVSTGIALLALPLLVLLSGLVVLLAWATHRVLGDVNYPQAWW
ncbi:MAG: HPP family protein [Actinomycetes bacterium]